VQVPSIVLRRLLAVAICLFLTTLLTINLPCTRANYNSSCCSGEPLIVNSSVPGSFTGLCLLKGKRANGHFFDIFHDFVIIGLFFVIRLAEN